MVKVRLLQTHLQAQPRQISWFKDNCKEMLIRLAEGIDSMTPNQASLVRI